MELVLDCSAVLSWLFPDEGDPFGIASIEGLSRMRAHVPQVWHLELANALLAAERRGRFTQAELAQLLDIIAALQIVPDDIGPDNWLERVVSIARTHGLSAYDASYLELAIRLGLPLATLDERLATAARNAGAAVYEP